MSVHVTIDIPEASFSILRTTPAAFVQELRLAAAVKETDNLAKAEEHISNAVQIAEQIGHPFLEEFRDGLARVRAAHQATSCG